LFTPLFHPCCTPLFSPLFTPLLTPKVVLFFSFVPIYHQSGERDTGEWQAACDANDVDALSAMGLS